MKDSDTVVVHSKSGTSPVLNTVTFVNGDSNYHRIQRAALLSQDFIPKVPCLLENSLGCCQNDIVFALRNLFPDIRCAFLACYSNGLDVVLHQGPCGAPIGQYFYTVLFRVPGLSLKAKEEIQSV